MQLMKELGKHPYVRKNLYGGEWKVEVMTNMLGGIKYGKKGKLQ